MKTNFVLFVLLFTILFIDYSQSFAQGSQFSLYKHKVILRVNEHDHDLSDIVGASLVVQYLNTRESIVNEFRGKDIGDGAICNFMVLPHYISKITFSPGVNEQESIIEAVIKDCEGNFSVLIEANILGWNPSVRVEPRVGFDIKLKLTTTQLIDTSGVSLVVTDARYDASNLRYKSYGFLTPDWLVTWILQRLGRLDTIVDSPLSDFIGEKFNYLPISYFQQKANDVVSGLNINEEIDAVLKSVPFEVSLKYYAGTRMNGIQVNDKLVIDLKFLHGYYVGNDIYPAFESYKPGPPPPLTFLGFGYNGDKISYISRLDTTESWADKFYELVTRMEDMGLNQLRIEAFWNKIVPPLTQTSDIDPSLNPDDITESMVINYMNDINSFGGWEKIDTMVDRLSTSNIVLPYIAVGVGHKDRPPIYIDSLTSTEYIIAPGTVRGANPDIFIIDEVETLHALYRCFRGCVPILVKNVHMGSCVKIC